MVASAASGLMLWAVADYGGDATKIRYTLAQTACGGSRVGVLSEGPLPVSGGHHDAGQGPTLTWIGMTTESMPLSMDSVGIIRALLPTGVFAFWSSTDLKWTPVYDCVAELQRENEGFWAVGGAGGFCQDRGINSGDEPSGIKKATVALDKKLVMKFRDLVQSKQLEAAYDTSLLALQIPATPRFMAKMALKLGQPLLAARIEEDMASVVIPSMPTGNVAQPVMAKPTPERQNRAIPPPSTAPPRSAFQPVENIPSRRSTGAEMLAETKEQEASKNSPIRGNPFANRKRRQNDDVDHTNAAKVLRADG
ncbi:hypothetical protein Pmar_PMAR008977 [Perkinsus marinus ATCC 50983]|uniref:WDHD1/CFT4 second beta-propeller domain-containing protein n=1 Tax=Perkinsus marinus (strain ATCC 50983 / TXsc) TaxID=423536 RepID=C5LM64_PERM5|nr:hypothetical protein Pmar_PMAR008977 [Perkinsus marinus ATCC 50983]EER02195.1 hypothetical protein Pmar_PMAR008977 [Perkinsus marinus ATCC 50983]|eukprot:XP_002769477.1 hypothetical protein Pmar_PMAR008977 [Perkinsus marinus ATCC 50983]